MKAIRRNGVLTAVALVLVLLVLCPLVMVFARAVIQDGRLDFSAAASVITDAANLTTITNTLLLGVLVVLGATALALPLAYLLARTSLGRAAWLDIALMVPFMTPPYIASMGWILFMQKNGLFQQLFPFTGGWSEGFFSLGGLVLVMSLHVFPFMLTILKNAILNISSSLEESAAIFGGGFWYRTRRVLLPLLSGNYAIGALLVFVKTLSEYGTPATLGKRFGFNVFTTDIHRYATTAPVNFGAAASLSGVLIGICMLMWFLQNYITTRKSYQLVGGKGVRTSRKGLRGPALAVAWCFVGLVLLVAIGVPYFSVIATSLIRLRGYGLQAGNFTLQHYVDLFSQNPKGRGAIVNSAVLAVVSASIASVLGTVLVVSVARSRLKARKAVEAVGLLPEMLPSIVLIIGIMLFWNGVYRVAPLYNTFGILVLAYVVLFLPFSIQYVSSALGQINNSLLWAGRSLGGTSLYVFWRITLPLLKNGIVAGWMMIFIISFRELVTASLIAPPNTLVVSTFIMREFEQGSVSVGMAMAVVCVLLTTTALLVLNRVLARQNRAAQ